jgi:hypothetical protein
VVLKHACGASAQVRQALGLYLLPYKLEWSTVTCQTHGGLPYHALHVTEVFEGQSVS